MADIKIKLGKVYRDRVLGTEGIATAHCKYISGCDHIQLSRNENSEVKYEWVDIVRLDAVPSKPVTVEKDYYRGGSADHPAKKGP